VTHCITYRQSQYNSRNRLRVIPDESQIGDGGSIDTRISPQVQMRERIRRRISPN
jgi:hypothetical protein